jgi:hypothetical protein
MATTWTTPMEIDDAGLLLHDAREVGLTAAPFPPANHPAENGDLDDEALALGQERWAQVLGW